jgi:hypothetical protein
MMTKADLLEHLNYCTDDMEIVINHFGLLLPIEFVHHKSDKNSFERKLVLIPRRSRGKGKK